MDMLYKLGLLTDRRWKWFGHILRMDVNRVISHLMHTSLNAILHFMHTKSFHRVRSCVKIIKFKQRMHIYFNVQTECSLSHDIDAKSTDNVPLTITLRHRVAHVAQF